MARGFAHGRIRPDIKGFQVTGGPVSKAGMLADSGTLNETFGDLRKKSSAINELPGLGLELDAKRYEADQYADMYAEKAKWDTKTIDAQYGSEADNLTAKGNSARNQGIGKFLTGAAVAGLTLMSDRRVKHSVEELDNALELLRGLRPVSFYYNEGYGDNGDRLHYGFIAQEYSEHMPDATHVDDDSGMLCINTMELIALLVKSNQELESRIARLEAKNALAGVA